MRKRSHLGRSLLLASLAIGLNVLCLCAWVHGHHAQRHAHINYSHIPPQGNHRPVSSTSRIAGNSHSNDQASRVVPKTRPVKTPPGMYATGAISFVPALNPPGNKTSFLPRNNTLSLSSASRSSSSPRAPPLA